MVYVHWKDWEDVWADGKSELGSHTGPLSEHNNTWRRSSNKTIHLIDANHIMTMYYFPVLVSLGVVLLFTILFNAAVCLIYCMRFKSKDASYLVVFLSATVLVMSSIVMPCQIAVLALPLIFYCKLACLIVNFLETSYVFMLMLLLSVIATDRYCRLTRPSNFLSLPWVKRLCILSVFISLILACPSFFVFSAQTTPAKVASLTGSSCGFAERAGTSPASIIYLSFLLFTFWSTLSAITVLYSLMCVKICRRKSAARGDHVSSTRRDYPCKHRFVAEESSCANYAQVSSVLSMSSSSIGTEHGSNFTRSSGKTSPLHDPARVPLKGGTNESARIGCGTSIIVDVHSIHTTWTFFLLSVMTMILMTVFVVMRVLQLRFHFMEEANSVRLAILYQTIMHLYVLHAPFIPVLYFVCNPSFRRELKHVIFKMGNSCACNFSTRICD